MKKRILIHMHYMALGGAERALLGLLNSFDPNFVCVDLFLDQHIGDFMPLIPTYVNLLPEIPEYTAIERPIKNIIKEGFLRIGWERICAKISHKIYYNKLDNNQKEYDRSIFRFIADRLDPYLPNINNITYDLAISFIQPHNTVLNKVNAKKKIAWIHTDYGSIHINVEKEFKIWSRYDAIASISDDCTKGFLAKFPTLSSKIILVENILSSNFILQQSTYDKDIEIASTPNCINLLSIGRFAHPKNYDNIPYISKILVDKGVNFKWYIIGDGIEFDAVKKIIRDTNMEKHVILLGKKPNPYPYIKACDLYVQPSRYEGKSVTVREAQILCKPVIVTNYATANSQINNGFDGIIVPMDNEGCAKGIISVIENKQLQKSLINYLSTHNYSNESEVKKVYNLLK